MATTKIRASKQIYFDADIDFNAKKITNLADGVSATDAVTKQQLDGLLDAVNGMQYKGVIDCSTNPNYPAASAGHLYIVSVGGLIGGGSGDTVGAGDLLLCKTDSTVSGTKAGVGSNWDLIRATGTIASGNLTETTSNILTITGGTNAVLGTGTTIQIKQSATGQSGYLSSTDWNTFNSKFGNTNLVTRETPSGTLNGSNVTFTLANIPVSGTEQLYVNGILQEPGAGNDYTISTSTITMLTAPISTDKIRVTYWK